jgi:hypothetical protein
VTEPAELTHDVLLRVAEFLRKLPAEQLQGLAAGTARLQVVSRPAVAARSAGALPVRQPTAPVQLPRPPDEIGSTLAAYSDRAEAGRYLDGLSLTVAQLRSLAKALGIAVASKATKAQARDTIVQWTVGRRVDAAILGRPAAAARGRAQRF